MKHTISIAGDILMSTAFVLALSMAIVFTGILLSDTLRDYVVSIIM